PQREGDEAGLALVLSAQFQYRFVKKRTKQGDFLVVEKRAEDFFQTACRIPAPEGPLCLQICAEKEFYTFLAGSGPDTMRELCRASTRFLSCEIAGKCFTGTVVGLYTACAEKTGAVMEVRRFEVW
ncbi:MAG: hypothetical protein Q4C65_09560, partial [Eubacteriales bacterium]|nr:hypothetical protein [Eubacteriales bacterium]